MSIIGHGFHAASIHLAHAVWYINKELMEKIAVDQPLSQFSPGTYIETLTGSAGSSSGSCQGLLTLQAPRCEAPLGDSWESWTGSQRRFSSASPLHWLSARPCRNEEALSNGRSADGGQESEGDTKGGQCLIFSSTLQYLTFMLLHLAAQTHIA